jgi:hypothetical protein
LGAASIAFYRKNQIFAESDESIFSIQTNVASTYTCPSDSSNSIKEDFPYNSIFGTITLHNYVACIGREGVHYPGVTRSSSYDTRNDLIDEFGETSQYLAMFNISANYPLSTTFASIVVGTSNTLALSETVKDAGPLDVRGYIWSGTECFFTTNLSPNTMVADNDLVFSVTSHVRHPLESVNMSTRYYEKVCAKLACWRSQCRTCRRCGSVYS